MDRVHYRRVMPSRYANDESSHSRRHTERSMSRTSGEEQSEITAGETIILQCIISGILMVAVLLVCLVDIGPTHIMKDGLRQALAGASTVNELVTDVRTFGEEWFDWGISEPQTSEQAPLEQADPYGVHSPPSITLPPATSPEYYFPMTVNPEESNPQNPGPSVVPGLWD